MHPATPAYTPTRAALHSAANLPPRSNEYVEAARPLLEDGVRLQRAGCNQDAASQFRQAASILRSGAYNFRGVDAGRDMASWADDYEQQALALQGAPAARPLGSLMGSSVAAAPADDLLAAVRTTRQQTAADGDAMAQVIGAQEAKDHLLAAIELPIKLPSLFNAKRKPWNGILMYGPPGTGKTLLARAAAAHVQSAFYCVDSAAIVSKWMGDSERFIKALFSEARSHAPAIIFIDEIDALLGRRGDNDHEMMRRVKTMLLTEMDGFVKNDRVVVIGATNRPWDLDDAALRRLQKRVLVPLPSTAERAQLFVSMLAGQPHALTARDFADFAGCTDYYSGADIANALTEASLAPVLAIYHATHFVTLADGRVHPCSADTPGAMARPADIATLDALPLYQNITREDVLAGIYNNPATTQAARYADYSGYMDHQRSLRTPGVL